MERFDAEGDTGDLDEAVSLLREAVADTGPGSPRHPLWLSNLADALLARFEATGTGSDLDEAVETAEQAVREAAGSSEVQDAQAEGILESGLGSALGARYVARGDEADLDRAIDLATAAVGAHPGRQRGCDVRCQPPEQPGVPCSGGAMRRAATWRDLQAAARCLGEPDSAGPQASSGMARWQAGLARALARHARCHR